MVSLVSNDTEKTNNDDDFLAEEFSILIVDDDKGAQSLMLALDAMSLSLSIDVVSNSADFHQLSVNKRWHIALVDCIVPDLSLNEITTQLNSLDGDTPVILVSDSITDHAISAALRSGVKGFVSKTVLSELALVITRELIDRYERNIVYQSDSLDKLRNLIQSLPASQESFENLSLGICKALLDSKLLDLSSVLIHFVESETARHTGIVSGDVQRYKLGCEVPVDLTKLFAEGVSFSDEGMTLFKGGIQTFGECSSQVAEHLYLPLSSFRHDPDVSFILFTFKETGKFYSLPQKIYLEISKVVNTVLTLFVSRIRQLRLERAVEMSPMSILMTDVNGIIEYVNQALVDKKGYSRLEILGNKPSMFNSGNTTDIAYTNLWQTIKSGQQWKGELKNRHKNGEILSEKINIFPVTNDSGTIINYVGVYEDISDLNRHKRRLDFMTSHDSVTGLINLQMFADRVNQSILYYKQCKQGVSIVTLSIVNFKSFNEQLGFTKSNIILKMIAEKIKSKLNPEESIARGNGAELVLLLPGLASKYELKQRFIALIKPFCKPMNYLDQTLNIQFFAGGSIYMHQLETVDQFLAGSQVSLYEAKNSDQRNQVIFAKSYIEGLDVSKSELVKKLDYAIDNNELELYYQIQVNAQTGLVRGCEVLVRWNSPDFGLLLPETFILVAEESDQIIALGDVVLRKSIQQLAIWEHLLSKDFVMSINLSSKQLRGGNLLYKLEELIRINEVKPSRLEFEIMESSIIESIENTLLVLQELRTLGCTVSLDDFGTGYSNLSLLRQIPLDVLKIDKCFIDRMTQIEEDALLCKMIIQLAQTMGLKVVAEGVETEAQSSMLKKLRCDYIQGYLYSKPVPVVEFEDLLRNPTWSFDKDDKQDILLIIDDERMIISSLRRLFRRTNMKVLTTTDPYEAMDIMAQYKVGVILSDQRMPEMLGTELLNKIKKIHPDTIRIMLSGYTDVETLSKAVNEGAIYKFIHKPWDDDNLLEEVGEAFKVYHRKHNASKSNA